MAMADPQSFNPLDRLIRALRLRRIRRYIPAGSMVCDIGCGDGTVLMALRKRGLIKQGTGLDPCASPGTKGDCEFIRTELLKAALPDRSYDVVLMLAVLEHFERGSVAAVMEEIRRILKPGGLLIMTTPTPLSRPVLEFLAFRLHLISEREIRGHRHYYGRDEMESLARQAKFDIVRAAPFQGGLNSFYVLKKKAPEDGASGPTAPETPPG